MKKKSSVLWFVLGALFIAAGVALVIYFVFYKNRVEFSSSGVKTYNLSEGKYTIYGSKSNDKTQGIQIKVVNKSKNEEVELVKSAESSMKKSTDPLLDFQINNSGEYELQVNLGDRSVSKPYVFHVKKLKSETLHTIIVVIPVAIGIFIIVWTHINRFFYDSSHKKIFFRQFYFK